MDIFHSSLGSSRCCIEIIRAKWTKQRSYPSRAGPIGSLLLFIVARSLHVSNESTLWSPAKQHHTSPYGAKQMIKMLINSPNLLFSLIITSCIAAAAAAQADSIVMY